MEVNKFHEFVGPGCILNFTFSEKFCIFFLTWLLAIVSFFDRWWSDRGLSLEILLEDLEKSSISNSS